MIPILDRVGPNLYYTKSFTLDISIEISLQYASSRIYGSYQLDSSVIDINERVEWLLKGNWVIKVVPFIVTSLESFIMMPRKDFLSNRKLALKR